MLRTTQTIGYKPNHVSPEKISQNFVSNTEKIAQLMGEEIRYIVYNSKNKLQDILFISKTNIMIDAVVQGNFEKNAFLSFFPLAFKTTS